MISLLLASLLGCTAAVVHIQPMDPVPDAHWIQLDDDGKAWDCVSRPDGKNWHPECVKVDYKNSAEPAKD